MRSLFSISGKVIPGSQFGRKLGYPTANLHLPNETNFYNKTGVYAAKVVVGKQQLVGMANIGFRPTLGQNSFTIEVNIFDFQEDIYGKMITIHFIQRLRDELKFNSPDELITRMAEDERVTRNIFLTLDKTDSHT